MFKKSLLLATAALALMVAVPAASAMAPPGAADCADKNATTKETSMSYSFTVRAATKSDALKAAAAQFDQVCSSQPIHERDRAQALQTVAAMAELVTIPEGKDLSLSVSGWASWPGVETATLTAASVTVTAGLADKTT